MPGLRRRPPNEDDQGTHAQPRLYATGRIVWPRPVPHPGRAVGRTASGDDFGGCDEQPGVLIPFSLADREPEPHLIPCVVCSAGVWLEVYVPEAERERGGLPTNERQALYNAVAKLQAIGPALGYRTAAPCRADPGYGNYAPGEGAAHGAACTARSVSGSSSLPSLRRPSTTPACSSGHARPPAGGWTS